MSSIKCQDIAKEWDRAHHQAKSKQIMEQDRIYCSRERLRHKLKNKPKVMKRKEIYQALRNHRAWKRMINRYKQTQLENYVRQFLSQFAPEKSTKRKRKRHVTASTPVNNRPDPTELTNTISQNDPDLNSHDNPPTNETNIQVPQMILPHVAPRMPAVLNNIRENRTARRPAPAMNPPTERPPPPARSNAELAEEIYNDPANANGLQQFNREMPDHIKNIKDMYENPQGDTPEEQQKSFYDTLRGVVDGYFKGLKSAFSSTALVTIIASATGLLSGLVSTVTAFYMSTSSLLKASNLATTVMHAVILATTIIEETKYLRQLATVKDQIVDFLQKIIPTFWNRQRQQNVGDISTYSDISKTIRFFTNILSITMSVTGLGIDQAKTFAAGLKSTREIQMTTQDTMSLLSEVLFNGDTNGAGTANQIGIELKEQLHEWETTPVQEWHAAYKINQFRALEQKYNEWFRTTTRIQDPGIALLRPDLAKMMNSVRSIVNKVESVRKIKTPVRQVPYMVCFHSPRPAQGKSTAVTSRIIPAVAKALGVLDTVYNLTGQSDRHAPVFCGENFTLCDEFLHHADTDKLLPMITQYVSSSPCGVHSAFDKDQFFQSLGIFTCSNQYKPTLSGLQYTEASQRAIYSRIEWIEVENPLYNEHNLRDQAWAELKYTLKGTNEQGDTETIMSEQEVIAHIVKKIIERNLSYQKAREEYRKRDPSAQFVDLMGDVVPKAPVQVANSNIGRDPFVISINSPIPGTQKSHRATWLADRLSMDLGLKVFHITAGPKQVYDFAKPSIYVIHDIVPEEQDFMRYLFENAGSSDFIISTSNLIAESKSAYFSCFGEHMFVTGFLASWLPQDYKSTWRRYCKIDASPAVARRLGLHGIVIINHEGKEHTISLTKSGMFLEPLTNGGYTEKSENVQYTPESLYYEITRQYARHRSYTPDTPIEHNPGLYTEEVDPDEWDIYVNLPHKSVTNLGTYDFLDRTNVRLSKNVSDELIDAQRLIDMIPSANCTLEDMPRMVSSLRQEWSKYITDPNIYFRTKDLIIKSTHVSTQYTTELDPEKVNIEVTPLGLRLTSQGVMTDCSYDKIFAVLSGNPDGFSTLTFGARQSIRHFMLTSEDKLIRQKMREYQSHLSVASLRIRYLRRLEMYKKIFVGMAVVTGVIALGTTVYYMLRNVFASSTNDLVHATEHEELTDSSDYEDDEEFESQYTQRTSQSNTPRRVVRRQLRGKTVQQSYIPRRTTRTKFRSKQATSQGQSVDGINLNQNLTAINATINKMANNRIILTADSKASTFALMLKGDIGVANYHLVGRREGAVASFIDPHGVQQQLPIQVLRRDRDTDLIFFRIPNLSFAFSDIIKYFVRDEDLSIMGPVIHVGQCGDRVIIRNGHCKPVTTNPVFINDNYNPTTQQYEVETVLGTGFATRTFNGECGTPYLMTNNTGTGRSVVGIHNGLRGSLLTLTCITQETIESFLTLPQSAEAPLIEEPEPLVYESDYQKEFNSTIKGFTTEDPFEFEDKGEPIQESKRLAPLGFAPQYKSPSLPRKNGYEKTIFYDDCVREFGEPKKIPVLLDNTSPEYARRYDSNLRYVPAIQQMEKINGDHVSQEHKFKAYLIFVFTALFEEACQKAKADPKPLREFEVLNGYRQGHNLYGGLQPITASTSCGIQYRDFKAQKKGQLLKTTFQKNGHTIFNWDDTDASRELKTRYERLVAHSQSGVDYAIIPFSEAKMKVELLPPEKNLRLFISCPFHQILFQRWVMGSMQAIQYHTSVQFPWTSGVDFEAAFGDIYDAHKHINDETIIQADASRFDKKMLPWVMSTYVQAWKAVAKPHWIQEGYSEEQVDSVFMHFEYQLIHNIVLMDGRLIETNGMFASGCQNTNDGGSVFTAIIMYYCILQKFIEDIEDMPPELIMEFDGLRVPKLDFWRKNIKVSSNGDDSLVSVPKWFNMTTQDIIDTMAKEGMTYTYPKTGENKRVTPLNDINFCSRTIRFDEYNLKHGLLKMDSILPRLYFIKGSDLEDYQQNVDGVLQDLYHYGEEVFTGYRNSIKAMCRKHNLDLTLRNFKELDSIFREKIKGNLKVDALQSTVQIQYSQSKTEMQKQEKLNFIDDCQAAVDSVASENGEITGFTLKFMDGIKMAEIHSNIRPYPCYCGQVMKTSKFKNHAPQCRNPAPPPADDLASTYTCGKCKTQCAGSPAALMHIYNSHRTGDPIEFTKIPTDLPKDFKGFNTLNWAFTCANCNFITGSFKKCQYHQLINKSHQCRFSPDSEDLADLQSHFLAEDARWKEFSEALGVDQFKADTLKHQAIIKENMALVNKALGTDIDVSEHDQSKFSFTELIGYGPKYYRNLTGTAWEQAKVHHFEHNKNHHPNNRDDPMSREQLIEALIDGASKGMQKRNLNPTLHNLLKELKTYEDIYLERFQYFEQEQEARDLLVEIIAGLSKRHIDRTPLKVQPPQGQSQSASEMTNNSGTSTGKATSNSSSATPAESAKTTDVGTYTLDPTLTHTFELGVAESGDPRQFEEFARAKEYFKGSFSFEQGAGTGTVLATFVLDPAKWPQAMRNYLNFYKFYGGPIDVTINGSSHGLVGGRYRIWSGRGEPPVVGTTVNIDSTVNYAYVDVACNEFSQKTTMRIHDVRNFGRFRQVGKPFDRLEGIPYFVSVICLFPLKVQAGTSPAVDFQSWYKFAPEFQFHGPNFDLLDVITGDGNVQPTYDPVVPEEQPVPSVGQSFLFSDYFPGQSLVIDGTSYVDQPDAQFNGQLAYSLGCDLSTENLSFHMFRKNGAEGNAVAQLLEEQPVCQHIKDKPLTALYSGNLQEVYGDTGPNGQETEYHGGNLRLFKAFGASDVLATASTGETYSTVVEHAYFRGNYGTFMRAWCQGISSSNPDAILPDGTATLLTVPNIPVIKNNPIIDGSTVETIPGPNHYGVFATDLLPPLVDEVTTLPGFFSTGASNRWLRFLRSQGNGNGVRIVSLDGFTLGEMAFTPKGSFLRLASNVIDELQFSVFDAGVIERLSFGPFVPSQTFPEPQVMDSTHLASRLTATAKEAVRKINRKVVVPKRPTTQAQAMAALMMGFGALEGAAHTVSAGIGGKIQYERQKELMGMAQENMMAQIGKRADLEARNTALSQLFTQALDTRNMNMNNANQLNPIRAASTPEHTVESSVQDDQSASGIKTVPEHDASRPTPPSVPDSNMNKDIAEGNVTVAQVHEPPKNQDSSPAAMQAASYTPAEMEANVMPASQRSPAVLPVKSTTTLTSVA